jgi:hypothetical protein
VIVKLKLKNMRKICAIIIFMATISTGLYAQGVSGGLKAGVNIANQKLTSTPTGYEASARVGYHVGGFLSCMFSDAFGIQPELLFNSVGNKVDNSGVSSVRRFSYLTLPVMFKYNPIPILNIHAGPQISTLLSAKEERGSDKVTISNVTPVEFGVAVGAGLDLPVGVTAAIRYNVGLSNINDDNSSIEATNNYLQLSVGYKFFGKK